MSAESRRADGGVGYDESSIDASFRVPRVVILCAPQDFSRAATSIAAVRSRFDFVAWDVSTSDALTHAERAALRAGALAYVCWSSIARTCPRVLDGIQLAGAATGESIDGTPLPPELERRPGRPSACVVGGMFIAAGALLIGASGIHLTALLLAGAGLALVETIRVPIRLQLSGRAHAISRWIARATTPEILARSEDFLSLVYGPRIWSARAMIVSACMSAGFVTPLILAFAIAPALGGASGLAVGLVIAVPLAVTNVALDFLALVSTRRIIQWILERPTIARVATGVAGDAVIFAVCAWGALHGNLAHQASRMLSGDTSSWIPQVLATLLMLASGELNLLAMWRSPSMMSVTFSGLFLVTGAYSSLVHLALLAWAYANRVTGGHVNAAIGAVLTRTAHSTSGIVPALYLALSAGAAFLSIDLSPPVPDVGRGNVVVQFPLTYTDPIDSELDRPSPVFNVELTAMATEVTQSEWQAIVDASADNAGLPRTPSVFRGSTRPVESISWCDALRFSNVRSRLEGLPLAYGRDVELSDCETDGVVWDRTAVGWRLPTPEEFSYLVTGGMGGRIYTTSRLDDSAWTRSNSVFRTHPVAQLAANPRGLWDTLGNVQEWCWGDTLVVGCAVAPSGASGGDEHLACGAGWFDWIYDGPGFGLLPGSSATSWGREADVGLRLVRGRLPQDYLDGIDDEGCPVRQR